MVHHKVIMKMENIFTPKAAITKLTSNLKQVSQRPYNKITRLLHHRIGMGFRNILDVKKRKKSEFRHVIIYEHMMNSILQ